MKHLTFGLLLAALGMAFIPTQALADDIRRACLQSDRRASTIALCGCIQSVASRILTKGDQKRGAKFFRDPQSAQDIRQSDRSSNERFWLRWKSFGETAQAICS